MGKKFDIVKPGKLPENFIVKNHTPQIAVLRQASLFITHGGMNSVSEVTIPFVSDQPVNARQAEKLGLGQGLDCKDITADKRNEMAMAVMEDNQIHKNLRMIQKIIAQAPGNAGAVGIIEAYYGKSRKQLGQAPAD